MTEHAHDDKTFVSRCSRSFASTGHAPVIDDAAALARLAAQRHVVLDDAGNIVLAHPFSSIPMGFSVMGAQTLWWGGCAWDSFALPHLLPDEPRVLVATTCPACDRALAWNVDRDAPPAGDEVAHFLVPAARDVERRRAYLRPSAPVLRRAPASTRGLRARATHVASVLDLATLWRLARGGTTGRLERGYRAARAGRGGGLLPRVGLRGEFWGL